MNPPPSPGTAQRQQQEQQQESSSSAEQPTMDHNALVIKGVRLLRILNDERKATEERLRQALEEQEAIVARIRRAEQVKEAIVARHLEIAELLGNSTHDANLERWNAALQPLEGITPQPEVRPAPTKPVEAPKKTRGSTPAAATTRELLPKKPLTPFVVTSTNTTSSARPRGKALKPPTSSPVTASAPDGSTITDVNDLGYLNKCAVICKDDDGNWVELRCPECGTNCDYTRRTFIRGRNGMQRHGAHAHQWTEKNCKIALKKTTHRFVPIEEVQQIATGELTVKKLQARLSQDANVGGESENQTSRATEAQSSGHVSGTGDSSVVETKMPLESVPIAKGKPSLKRPPSLEDIPSRKSMKINQNDSPLNQPSPTKPPTVAAANAGPVTQPGTSTSRSSTRLGRTVANVQPSYKEAEVSKRQPRTLFKNNKELTRSLKGCLKSLNAMKAAEPHRFAAGGQFLRIPVPGHTGPPYLLQDHVQHRAEEALEIEQARLEEMTPEERAADAETKAQAEAQHETQQKDRSAEQGTHGELKPSKEPFNVQNGKKMARLWRQLTKEEMEANHDRGLVGAMREAKEEAGDTLKKHEKDERKRKVQVSGAEKERRRYLGYVPL